MFLKIPHKDISPDTLRNLIEEFVTRDGTDYGENEVLLEHRFAQIVHKLESDDLLIVFDETSETCELISAEAWKVLSTE